MSIGIHRGGRGMEDTKEMSLDELVILTQNFIKLADELYSAGKLSKEEYTELTYIKKDFLQRVEADKQETCDRYFQ